MREKQSSIKKSERDPVWFLWFLTFVMISLYGITLFENSHLRKPVWIILFTIMMAVHIVLHWKLGKLLTKPKMDRWYILIQGAIGLALVILSRSIILPVAIFMGLIGEGVGVYGLSLRSVLATTYYLLLAFIGMLFIPNNGPLWGWALGLIPVLFFVVLYVVLYQRQLEAKEEAQRLLQQLETANLQLSEYAVKVEDLTILSERQRMARDLHDTLSQGLAGLILQLEAADAHLSNQRYDKAGEIIHQSMDRARSTLNDARKTIGDLRGNSVIQSSLVDRIQNEIEKFSKLCSASCEFDHHLSQEIPIQIQEATLRVVSESLNNIARHASAEYVKISLFEQGDHLRLTISDDGCGFDPTQGKEGHYGLIGMRERVNLSGGEFLVISEPGRGTTVDVQFPQGKSDESN